MTNTAEIIDKVQKLLALATSPNEHEAKLAASKAHELLAKYNLSLEQVEESRINEEYVAVDKEPRGSAPPEDRYLFTLLQNYFYVKIVTYKYSEQFRAKPDATYVNGRLGYRRRYRFTLVGRTHNVQIARFVYDFLFRSFRSSFLAFCKAQGLPGSKLPGSVKRGYYHGLYYGLKEQLEANVQKALADAKALVVAEDPNIKKFMDQQFGKLKDGGQRRNRDAGNQVAIRAGYEDGKNMKIAVGVTGTTTEQPQIGQVLGLEDKR